MQNIAIAYLSNTLGSMGGQYADASISSIAVFQFMYASHHIVY